MADPLSLVALGAAVGGAAGKFVEKAWNSGEKWITSYFADHRPKAIAQAQANSAEFLTVQSSRPAYGGPLTFGVRHRDRCENLLIIHGENMKMWPMLIIFVTLFSGVGNNAIAQDRKIASKQTRKVEAYANLPPIPFDISQDRLPPGYNGADIAALYSYLIKKAPLKKDEFETKEEYENKVLGAVPNDIYAFNIKESTSSLSGLNIKPYDSDKKQYQVVLKTEYLSEYTHKDYRASFILKTVNKRARSYIGSNAFGATREVSDYSATQYGIALTNEQNFGVNHYSPSSYGLKSVLDSIRILNINIEVPIDRARSLKNNIGVLLLCKPSLYKSDKANDLGKGNQLIFETYNSSRATIDSPTSHFYERMYINVEVLAIWVYDIRTGEVLSKNPIKSDEQK